MDRADVFVFYDVVQYDKNGWRNRNRIKTAQGLQWLSVPVLQKNRNDQKICDVEIDNRRNWARKHISSLQQAYARAPYTAMYITELSQLLERSWTHLSDLDFQLTMKICQWLDLPVQVYRCSELDVGGGRNERLLNICQHFGAERYISGDSAKGYLDVESFEQSGIAVEWQEYSHPQYRQLHADFSAQLSVVDLIFNHGDEALSKIRQGRPE